MSNLVMCCTCTRQCLGVVVSQDKYDCLKNAAASRVVLVLSHDPQLGGGKCTRTNGEKRMVIFHGAIVPQQMQVHGPDAAP
jgi:hypothetical protein